MSLNQVMHFNDFSTEFRKELRDRVKGFGKQVRYKFNVGLPNPDPNKYDGDIIYPNMYTLDPVQFYVKDKYEKRGDKSDSKLVSLILERDDKGVPNKFKKVKAEGKRKSILTLDLENSVEDFEVAMYLELHPKTENGLFPNITMRPIVQRIDEVATAKELTTLRNAKRSALNAVADMEAQDIKDFSDAMQWDSTEDIEVLRNKIEEMAESVPDMFNDLIASKELKYQATIQKAINKGIIVYDPANGTFKYKDTGFPLATISKETEVNENTALAKLFLEGGAKMEEAYKKIQSLLGVSKTVEKV